MTAVIKINCLFCREPFETVVSQLKRGRGKFCSRRCRGFYEHARNVATFSERFWQKVIPEPNSGCWLWIGAASSHGYGSVWYQGHTHKVHRVAYQLLVGPIPDGLDLMHSCDVRCCVNPEHLSPGTTLQNVEDMWRKGRGQPRSGERNGRSKLTSDGVAYIFEMYRSGHEFSTIARKMQVDRSTVSRIIKGRAWRAPQ